MKSISTIALALSAGLVLVAGVAEAAPQAPSTRASSTTQVAQQKKPTTKSGKRPRKAPAKAAAPAPVVEETPVAEAPAPAPEAPKPAPLVADTEPKAVVPFAAPDADVAPTRESPPGARPSGIGGAFVVAALGFDIGGRSLAYNDRLTSNLRTYDVLGAPSLGGSVELYPFAGTTTPVVRDLGLVGGYRQAFALSSRTEAGDDVKTSWSRFDLGVRFRGRLGSGERPVVLGASIGYKREAFTFEGSTAIQNEMPSVAYSCMKLGGDARIPVGPLAITAAAAFLPVLSSGAVAARLRESTVGAVEGEIGVAVPFGKSFEGRLGASYTRYFYAFHPQPGDVYVAGGAVDQIVRGQTALAFLY